MRNIGKADRAFRLLAAAAIVTLYSLKIVTGTVGYILLAFAGIFLLTGLIRICPLYLPFKASTCGKECCE